MRPARSAQPPRAPACRKIPRQTRSGTSVSRTRGFSCGGGANGVARARLGCASSLGAPIGTGRSSDSRSTGSSPTLRRCWRRSRSPSRRGSPPPRPGGTGRGYRGGVRPGPSATKLMRLRLADLPPPAAIGGDAPVRSLATPPARGVGISSPSLHPTPDRPSCSPPMLVSGGGCETAPRCSGPSQAAGPP